MQDLKHELDTLRTKYRVLQSSIESFNDILIFSIDKDYKYLNYNSAFKSATLQAYGIEVVAGMSMLDSITNPEDRVKAKGNCDRALEGENVVTVEVYGDLTRYYFETRYNPIYSEDAQIIGVTVMSANITARKQAEEQLQIVNRELESFSYSISHDLRAPLRSINGYAAILQEDFTDGLSEDAKRMLSTIRHNAQKMGNLIDDLLAFSKLGRKDITRGWIDMDELFRSVVGELYDPNTMNPVAFHIKPLLSVSGDMVLLRQVCFNLVSNALKYSAKSASPEIEIDSSETETHITYSVKDNGVGFDMQYYDKLFGVFQRLHSDDDFEGTGVGLAIVQKIVERRGGKVWAESKVSEGSTFSFSLPKIEV